MQEAFGKVTLTYADGAEALERVHPEDEELMRLLNEGFDCRLASEVSWPVLYHLSHLRANLTEWLPIGENDTVLEFGSDSGQLTGGILKKAKQVLCLDRSVSRSRILARRYQTAENLTVHAGDPWEALEGKEQSFDWILAAGLLADAPKYFSGDAPEAEALRRLRAYLKPDGHLVVAADNRFGLKYWAGAAEPHTGRYFDSLTGEGRTFSRAALLRILEAGGCADACFYYPYPERYFPTAIYSDAWLPKPGELNRNLRNFEGERLVLFDEEKVYDQLIADGRFPEFSNVYLCVIGPAFPERPVFIKYSNDRAKRFMIRTEIVESAAGREVRKIPVSDEAREHVREMKRSEERLNRQWSGCALRANRCTLRGDAACFEFLRGQTLEEKLDVLRLRKDYAGLAEELLRYKELVYRALEQELEPFQVSARFTEMFGKPSFSRAYQGAAFNNLDWILGNLMETADGWQVIDYEWSFPVQVPVEYLIWRAASLYLSGREDVRQLGLMAQLSISPEEEALFAEMEHHFQLWLLDGAATIGAQYLATAGRTLTLSGLLGDERKRQVQLYVDTGNGFSEQESRRIGTEPDKCGVIRLELVLPPGTRALRLDPAEEPCIVKVKRLAAELGGSYTPAYVHNGRELEDQGILYTTSDPQITVPELTEGTGRLYMELCVQPLAPDAAFALMELLNRVRAAERITGSTPYRWLKRLKKQLIRQR